LNTIALIVSVIDESVLQYILNFPASDLVIGAIFPLVAAGKFKITSTTSFTVKPVTA
jgi:hypothetical protein